MGARVRVDCWAARATPQRALSAERW
jgi:hypothetical protein